MENSIKNLEKILILANAGKIQRLLHSPFRYVKGLFFSKFIYPFFKKSWKQTANTFWGEKMQVALPAGLDIYLLGAKTHESEIRLAHFLYKNCSKNVSFVDIGAHFGFFSALAASRGSRVLAFEPSPFSYKIAAENLEKHKNVELLPYAVGEKTETNDFYIFPPQYSEYNSFSIESLPKNIQKLAKKINIQTMNLSQILAEKQFNADIIKIDVEGAELEVINGLDAFFKQSKPILIIEFIANENENYQKVEQELKNKGYFAYSITQNGELMLISDTILNYMKKNKLDSDNVVFNHLIPQFLPN